MQLAMVDDRLIEAGKLDSAYFDHGVFFGDGVYEVLRSYDGRLFALEEGSGKVQKKPKRSRYPGALI